MAIDPVNDCFVVVPETVLPNGETVQSFLASQFLCSAGKTNMQRGAPFYEGKRQASSTNHGIPWININYFDAKIACEAAGYTLLTEKQWLAIAWNCASVDVNWTGGRKGKGMLIQGLVCGGVSQPQPGSYTTTIPNCRRWLMLSNDEMIFDIGGNARHWVFDDVHGDADGLTAVDVLLQDDISLKAPAASKKQGTGWRSYESLNYSCKSFQKKALARGGHWGEGDSAGAFRLEAIHPMIPYSWIGFRCSKPLS
jgi:hypothetical protein